MADINTSVLAINGNNLILQDAAIRGSIADTYSASSTYAVGDMVLKDGQLYKCNTAISTAEAWTAAHWTAVTVGGELATVKDGLRNRTLYVAPSGNDSNDGSETKPLATINMALTKGATVVMLSAGTYFQSIDLSLSQTGTVDLKKIDGVVRFKPTQEQKIITSETKESGYNKVYSGVLSETITAGNNWIYQENVADASTLITDGERHPLERGYTNRCASTCIKKCSSANLADALAEIDNSDEYLWFADGGKLYFSRPSTVTSTHPISISRGEKLFLNNSPKNTICMNGIRCEFIAINLDKTRNSEIADCSAGYIFGSGGITYDDATNTKLIRCEAYRVCNGSTGDGINAHVTSGSGLLAKRTTGTLLDCWSHDNRDDGFSDHEWCESTIIGGLFEYNGKSGITPSYGSQCTCYSALSRNNYNGFYYTGASADTGIGGQLLCVGCASENNTRGNNQAHAGFLVDSSDGKLILVNCHTSGNAIGYYVATGSTAYISGCTQADTQATFGKSRMVINNGTLVAPS